MSIKNIILKPFVVISALALAILTLSSCGNSNEPKEFTVPEKAQNVSTFAYNPTYNKEVTVYGEFSPASTETTADKSVKSFDLLPENSKGGEQSLKITYDDNILVDELESGDIVSVTGKYNAKKEFKATKIEKLSE